MSGGRGVEFELVDDPSEAERGPGPDPSPPERAAGEDPMAALDPETSGSPDPSELEEAEVEPFDEADFPLAGPILEAGKARELTGRCSSCETRLRIRVNGPGAVRVRCPICGHARRIEV